MASLLKYLLLPVLIIGIAGCSSEKQRRMKWNMETTVGDYEKIGHRDPKWDADAKEALTCFAEWRAGDAVETALAEKIGPAAQKAVDAGCQDPFILYLRARFVVTRTSHNDKDIADTHRRAANGFKESYYSSLRRFYGALRAGETLYKSNPNAKLDCTILMNDAARALVEAINEDNAPHAEIFTAARAFCWSFSKMKINTDRGWSALEPLLRKKWGNKYQETLALSRPVVD